MIPWQYTKHGNETLGLKKGCGALCTQIRGEESRTLRNAENLENSEETTISAHIPDPIGTC